jgi:hypothetical protein
MALQRLFTVLTLVNFALLLWLLAGPQQVTAESGATVLRGRALQIVDAKGRVRASLSVLPPDAATDGSAGEETVLFRLINAEGQPTVKLGASATAGGLSLVGGDDESYVVLEADGPRSALKLVGPHGAAKTIEP